MKRTDLGIFRLHLECRFCIFYVFISNHFDFCFFYVFISNLFDYKISKYIKTHSACRFFSLLNQPDAATAAANCDDANASEDDGSEDGGSEDGGSKNNGESTGPLAISCFNVLS